MSYATHASTRATPSSSPRAGQPPRPPPGGSGGGDDDDPSGGGGGPPGPPPGAVGGHPVLVFALTPARAIGGFIDHTSRHGQRLYESATTAKLGIEFECNSALLCNFVGLANKRAIECNWKMTTLIEVNGVQHDLFDQYGFLTTEQIPAHVNTYVGTQTCDAQNAFQMAECFNKTETKSARTHVTTRKDKYTVDRMVDGLLYFKAIVKTASIDTCATTTTLQNKLASLDHHMQEILSNVRTFIVDVKSWQQNLLAHGETTNDLIVNVICGLKACSDPNFVRYIARKEDDYNERQDITMDKLLNLAGNKYKSLVELGDFNQPAVNQKKILALTAQLQKLSKASKKSKKTTPTQGSSSSSKQKSGSVKSGKSGANSENGKKLPTQSGRLNHQLPVNPTRRK